MIALFEIDEAVLQFEDTRIKIKLSVWLSKNSHPELRVAKVMLKRAAQEHFSKFTNLFETEENGFTGVFNLHSTKRSASSSLFLMNLARECESWPPDLLSQMSLVLSALSKGCTEQSLGWLVTGDTAVRVEVSNNSGNRPEQVFTANQVISPVLPATPSMTPAAGGVQVSMAAIDG